MYGVCYLCFTVVESLSWRKKHNILTGIFWTSYSFSLYLNLKMFLLVTKLLVQTLSLYSVNLTYRIYVAPFHPCQRQPIGLKGSALLAQSLGMVTAARG